jgi:hypothetical protein
MSVTFKITSADIKYRWNIKSSNSDCDICKIPLLMMSPDIYDDKKYLVINNKLKQGKCSHIFHSKCIDKIHVKEHKDVSNNCPTCNKQWIIHNILNTDMDFK